MENGEISALSVSDKASPNMEDSTLRPQQSTESFPSNNVVMGQHSDLRRPLLSTTGGRDDHGFGPDSGATEAERCHSSPSPRISGHIFPDAAAAAVPITGGDSSLSSASAVVARILQPFHFSPTQTAFKTPGRAFNYSITTGEGGMEKALGFPFTAAQRNELERQAMIYKYMMASVPVPPDLLSAVTSRCISADPTAPLSNGNGPRYNLQCGSNRDLEPGRCKRTDGKKWRCSRDVAPHQKYCERHMHRGRPRSRKTVEKEVHPSVDTSNNKKTRPHPTPFQTNPTAPTAEAHNNLSPLFLGNINHHKDPLSILGGASCKNISVSSHIKEPNRVPYWMMDDEMAGTNGVEQQWLHLMDAKGAHATILQQSYEEERSNLFSYTDFVPEDMQNRAEEGHLFLNANISSLKQPQVAEYPMSRGFLEAWSNGNLKPIDDSSVSSSQGNLSPSSLNLSIGMVAQEGMGLSGVCRSVADSNNHEPKNCPLSWLPFPSGGPLAEALQPSSITGGSNPASPYTTNGDPISPSATVVSSPSGVLHRALFSHSDSSVCNSPTIAASSAPSDQVVAFQTFQWLS